MTNKRDVQLGREIQQARKRVGLTQEQLADKTGLSLTYIGYLEIGKKRPSLDTLIKIADILQTKVRDLIPF